MLTMVVNSRLRLLGHIEGSTKGRPGTDDAPHVVLSELGKRIVEQEIPKIHRFYPMIEVWREICAATEMRVLNYTELMK